jgi:hypothetical protein
MARLGRADEVVVADEQSPPHRIEAGGQVVDPLLRCDARRFCALQHLEAVLVHAHDEVHVLAA